MLVHVFRGANDAYGLTQDAAGTNLPASAGPWRAFKSINLDPNDPRIALDAAAAHAAISKQGYYLTAAKTDITVTTSGGERA